MNEINSQKIESLSSKPSDESIINLIKQIKRLIPITDQDKMWKMKLLIEFVDGLINGDDITQYTTSSMMTPLAKKALSDITRDAQESTQASFIEERNTLRKELTDLQTEKSKLEESVRFLSTQKKELLEKTVFLETEITRLNEEARSKQKSLEDEIASLNANKAALSKSIEELKKLLNSLTTTVSKLSTAKSKCTVTWEPINKTHIIFSANKDNIDEIIKSLKLEYVENTGVSAETCEQHFNTHCPGLSSLRKLTNIIDFSRVHKGNIMSFLNRSHLINSDYDMAVYSSISETLSRLRLPNYKFSPIYENNIDSMCVTPDTLPTSVQSMMRELHFQRIALEAISKQKILEAELKTVLNVLAQVAPKDYDFSSLEKQLASLDEININESESSKLTL